MILTIAKAELRRMFYSPLAWATLAVVLFILGLLFLILVDNYLTTIQAQLVGIPGAPGVTDIVLAPVMLWAGVIMLTVSPLQTMRAFSEERQQGSLTLLTSAPLSTTELVLGKYLALLVFILVLLGLLALIPLSLAGATQLDWGKIMASLLGLFTAGFVLGRRVIHFQPDQDTTDRGDEQLRSVDVLGGVVHVRQR
jgi:ABC-2 type transport system permease protein